MEQAAGSNSGMLASVGAVDFVEPQLKKGLKTRRQIRQMSDFGTESEIALWAVLYFKKGAGGIEEGESIRDLAKEAEYAIVWKLVPGGKE
jgi:hypothetical protein